MKTRNSRAQTRAAIGAIVLALASGALSAHADSATDPVDGGNIPGRSAVRRGQRSRPVPGQRLAHGQNWWAAGRGCLPDSTQVLFNGETFSVVMDDMRVDLPQGDRSRGTEHEIGCTINILLTPPPGMMFGGLYQTISGGVVKSEKSRVAMRANYSIGPHGFHADPVIYPRGAVAPTDNDSTFTMTLEDTKLPTMPRCQEQVRYRMRMVINAMRASPQTEFVSAGIDTLDGQFVTNVRPVYVPCRGR